MVSSMSLSEVVSSQGRFIAATKEHPPTPVLSQPAPRGLLLPSLPPSQPGFCRRDSRSGAVCSSRLFPTPLPSRGARAGAGHAPRAGGGPSSLPRARPGRPPGPASPGRRGFLLANMEGRARSGQWPPRGVGRGVGTRPRTWSPELSAGGDSVRRARAGAGSRGLVPSSARRDLSRRVSTLGLKNNR